ncbi:Uncharacterised protein [Mycobacteroides abscessus subsp. abscessus]|nr:Uncharacterised protein [Mycobacteroides abscessus subsp. abscessus]
MHIDAMRRQRACSWARAATRVGFSGLPISMSPPATNTVSAHSIESIVSVTENGDPIEVDTSRPSTEATTSR